MGFFTSRDDEPEVAPVEGPQPVTQERLKALFEKRGWNYFVDNEGDLGGVWDDTQFWFLLRGNAKEILHIQSRWHGSVDIERLEPIRDFIDRWHRDKLWPKCYHRVDDEGRVRVFAEVTIDHEQGATDDQLMQHVVCALGTSNQFYTELESALGLEA